MTSSGFPSTKEKRMTGTVQTGKEKALGDLITVYKNLKEDTKKIESSSF